MKKEHKREMILRLWWTTETHQYRKNYVRCADVRQAILNEIPFAKCTVKYTKRGQELLKEGGLNE